MILSVIIPTLNGAHLLKKNLPSVVGSLLENTEIIIVDNGSKDDTGTYIKEKFPVITYIQLNKNAGFTGACNAGCTIAKGKFVCFLNNDCSLEKDTFTKLLLFLEQNPNITATQPVVKKPNGQTEHIGFWIDTKLAKAHTIISKKQYEQISQDSLLYGVSGTCLLIKNDVFKKVGLFNKMFHSYLEDVDLAVTLHEKGYTVKPYFEAFVTHEHMATSSNMGHYKQKQDVINWWRIALNHKKTFSITPLFLLERLKNISGLFKKLLTLN